MANKILYSPSGRAGEYSDKGLACNFYSGCIHGCRYCYVPGTQYKSREQFNASCELAKNDPLARLKKDCEQVHDEPIFFSFNSDLFQPLMYCSVNSLKAMQIVKESGNRVRILTKGFIPDPVLELLTPEDEVGVTLTLLSECDCELWEPKAAPPDVRIENLKRASKRGIKTWASFEPVIDPEQTLNLIDAAAPYLDIAKIGMSNHLSKWDWPSEEWRNRVESIDWAEFGIRAAKVCAFHGLEYYIKLDLRTAMQDGQRKAMEVKR